MKIMKLTQRLNWLLHFFPSDRRAEYSLDIKYWLGHLDKQCKSRGPVDAIKIAKATRNHVTKYLAGEPVHTSLHPSLGLNKSGIPRILNRLQRLLKGDENDLRFLMTLLVVSREISAWNPVDYTPISEGPKVPLDEDLIEKISCEIENYPHSFDAEFEGYHISSKTGPNGLALDTSIVDLRLLPESGIARDIVTLGGQTLRDKMNETFEILELIPIKPRGKVREKPTLRRLSIKKDKEGKSRVFAILDYWSQCALKPLHSDLLKVLKKFKADCTFDQGSRLGRVIPRPFFHSIDLSNATDRFPIQLQIATLGKMIGQEKALAWGRILTHLPYTTPEGGSIAYAVGQPMGAYSSWPMFALCHHLVIQHSARLAGEKLPYENYMMLGDDVVLGDDHVAKHYMTILERLGVETSPSKTHTSKTTYEFAKRWIHNGMEITGVPLSSLSEYQGPSSVLSFLETIERNWHLPYQTYSRSELARLLRSTDLPSDKLRLETQRIWEARLLPSGPLSRPQNWERNWRTFQVLCSSYLGCSVGYDRVLLVLNQFIPMAKIKAATTAIKDTVRDTVKYRVLLIKQVASEPTFDKGLLSDLPALLAKLPILESAMAYARNAQLELDKLEDSIAEGHEEDILRDPPVLGFNPLKLDNRNRDSVLYYVHSKVPKVLKSLVKEYLAARSQALSEGEVTGRGLRPQWEYTSKTGRLHKQGAV